MRLHLAAVSVALACGVITTTARAQNPDPTDIRGCTAIESDAQRLACYDQVTGRVNLPVAQKRQVPAAPPNRVFDHERTGNRDVATPLSLLDWY